MKLHVEGNYEDGPFEESTLYKPSNNYLYNKMKVSPIQEGLNMLSKRFSHCPQNLEIMNTLLNS